MSQYLEEIDSVVGVDRDDRTFHAAATPVPEAIALQLALAILCGDLHHADAVEFFDRTTDLRFRRESIDLDALNAARVQGVAAADRLLVGYFEP